MVQRKSTEVTSTTIEVSRINVTGRTWWLEQFCKLGMSENERVYPKLHFFSLQTNALKNELMQK